MSPDSKSRKSTETPRLIIREGGVERTVQPVGDPITIGRSKENEIEIDDISSSRRHCRIGRKSGHWMIEDLQSRNGTMVNGILIRQKDLQPGDCIEIGKTRLYFDRVPTEDLIDDGEPTETLLLPTDFFMEPITEVSESSQLDVLKREREIFLRLLEINKKLGSTLVVSELLGTILDTVLEITKAERGFIILEDDGELKVRASRNIDKEAVRRAEVKVSRSITQTVIEEGRPVLTGTAQTDHRMQDFPSVADLRLESVLSVPLRIRGQVIGVIYVDNRFEEDAFHRNHLRFIEFLADQAAIAIENARLFEENQGKQEDLRRSKEEVEHLNRELQEMLLARDLQLKQVTDVVTRQAERRFKHDYDRIITKSPKMYQLFEMLDRIVDTDIPVLVQGESGTGKELIANAIHYEGKRKKGPFISQNCAAIPPNLLESEFFGHVRGAFTGAVENKKGLFELANGGTLFLDEIGDMSLDLQTKLLRVLEEGEIRQVGGKEIIKVDVRIISATNRALKEMIAENSFREDLYYRLNVINVTLPPLRERREDVLLLVEHFLARICERTGRDKPEVDGAAYYHLYHYDWPGNVRELENEIERVAALAGERITVEHLSPSVVAHSGKGPVPGAGNGFLPGSSAETLKEVVSRATEELECQVIATTLRELSWNKSKTAKRLGVSRPTLDQKIDKYSLKKPSK